MKTKLLFLLTFFISTTLFSQQNFTHNWTYNSGELQGDQYIFPSKFNSFELDFTSCKDYLYQAFLYDYAGNIKQSGIEIILPMPDGSLELFKIAESPVYEPEFAAEFPEIRTFLAYAPNHPNWYSRFDITPMGFHAIILNTEGGTIYIDPIIYRGEDVNHYFSYYKKDWQRNEAFSCYFDEGRNTPIHLDTNHTGSTKMFGTCQLRTYRLAVAATGEYTTFQGGTVALAAAAQVTTMNRVNGVYEMDMGIHMNIIGNNSLLIYTNSATDPYTNGTPGTMIGQNQTNVTNVIGSANYDIGHVFGTNSGGLAGLGVVCSNSSKARGVTGSGAPVGDSFDIDYVAHEMGHQFNANHTFNNSCSGNRNSATAMEPGSATTIMGYAGICPPDIQSNSDDYFHGISLQEIGNLITGASHTCPIVTNLSNSAPTVTYNPTTINLPISTPFALTATASDPNVGDTLRYLWEQMDNQTATMPPVSTSTGGPNFRSFDPSTSPTRYFPNLAAVVAGITPTWEVLPSVPRTMHFRVTVHDNFPGANCNDHQDITVNFVSGAGPFTVTYPTNSGITWAGNSTQTVTWNVANTGSGSTVNCSNVNILISYDGGLTFADTILANTPNDGNQTIIVPNHASTTALIMVQCANGTFFDVSNNVFTITAVTNDFTLNANPASQIICGGSNAEFSVNVGKLGTFNTSVALSTSGLPGALSTSFSSNNQTPNYSSTFTISNTSGVAAGTYNFTLSGTGATGTKNVPLTLVIVGNLTGAINLITPANTSTGVGMPTNFTWSNINGANYSIAIATDVAFANIVESVSGLSSASYTSTILAANTMYYWQVVAINTCDTATSSIFSFTTVNCATYASTDVPKTISASGTPTITSNLPITGSVGTINDINVIDLTGTHTYINDLTFTLTSPSGTSVDLIDQICGDQNNFNVNFDDEAASSTYPCPPTNGGTYIPENLLSAFDGESVNGTWILTIHDNANQDGGSLDTWGLEICFNPPLCSSVSENVNISGCDSVQINSTWYYTSTTINDTLQDYFGSGCDSITNYNLTINNSLNTSANQSACDSAFVSGSWYFTSQSISQTFTSATNCDSTHTVVLTINNTSAANTINTTTCNASLVGSDTTTFSNVNGCDSIVITNTTLLPTAFGSTYVSGCDSVLANGTWYFASTSFNDTLSGQAANGCDSVVTYNVSISNSIATAESISACDSANINGTWYFASQNIVATFTSANSCDSTHTVSLTINNTQSTSANQSACDSAFVFGSWYFASQSVSQTFVSNANCDSTHTVVLTINNASPTNTINTTTCNASLVGSDTTTFSNVNGCDSVVITNTTLLPTAFGSTNVSGCDSVLANGTWYFASTSFNDTLSGQAANGCDSVVTYNVSISNSVATTESISACDSANINGTWYFASQNIVATFTAVNSCDSTHTVSLTINNAQNTSANQSVCDSAFVSGSWYFTSQSISQTYTSAANCDSTHTVVLTINNTSATNTINTTTCNASLVGSDTTTFSNVNGCDSVVITNTTLLPTSFGSTNVSGCDSVLANGTWYFASTSFNDTLSGQAANGCDSVVTYNVSISNSVATSENLTACDSANINGTWYFASQNIVATFTAANSCDSIHTVSLTINNAQNTSANQSACDSAFVFGSWYFASQSVSQTFVSNANCDSTHTVVLTINNTSAANTINTTTCNASLVGSDTTTFSNVNGCDSVVITNTTLIPTAFGSTNVSGCDSALANGTWYFASTSFNDTLSGQAANGCDSVVTYNVSISNSVYSVDTSIECGNQDSILFVSHFTANNGCDSTHYQIVYFTKQADSSFIQSTSCEPMDTGLFINNYTNLNGCDSIVVEEISYEPFILEIQTTNDTQFITQDVNLWVNALADNYNWNTLNTSLSNDSAFAFTSNFIGDYLLIVDGNRGPCFSSDSLRLYFISNHIEPGIPTGFSPNGDGTNDYFYVLNYQYFDWIEIKVLSERNQVMFYGSGENPKWDGTFKDSNAPIEVYIYSIRAKVKYTGEIIDKNGNVSLIR